MSDRCEYGSGHVGLLSAFAVSAAAATPEMNSGSLHRYLAEAVWYPTALLVLSAGFPAVAGSPALVADWSSPITAWHLFRTTGGRRFADGDGKRSAVDSMCRS